MRVTARPLSRCAAIRPAMCSPSRSRCRRASGASKMSSSTSKSIIGDASFAIYRKAGGDRIRGGARRYSCSCVTIVARRKRSDRSPRPSAGVQKPRRGRARPWISLGLKTVEMDQDGRLFTGRAPRGDAETSACVCSPSAVEHCTCAPRLARGRCCRSRRLDRSRGRGRRDANDSIRTLKVAALASRLSANKSKRPRRRRSARCTAAASLLDEARRVLPATSMLTKALNAKYLSTR